MPDRIALRYDSRHRFARVRELHGDDVEWVGSADRSTRTALDLLDRLLVAGPEAEGSRLEAADLAVSDRDRVLAAIYIQTYGSRISSTVGCTQCEARFDIDFQLADLVRSLDDAAAAASVSTGPDGILTLADGRRFRVPTGRDERAARGRNARESAELLLAVCALDGVQPGDDAAVAELMRAAAPLVSTDLAAHCPECGLAQSFRFDLQGYLLATLAVEGEGLVEEVHRIASAYRWSRAEILALPRSQRRRHVSLIEARATARHPVVS